MQIKNVLGESKWSWNGRNANNTNGETDSLERNRGGLGAERGAVVGLNAPDLMFGALLSNHRAAV